MVCFAALLTQFISAANNDLRLLFNKYVNTDSILQSQINFPLVIETKTNTRVANIIVIYLLGVRKHSAPIRSLSK